MGFGVAVFYILTTGPGEKANMEESKGPGVTSVGPGLRPHLKLILLLAPD